MSNKISHELISIGEVSIPFYEDRLIVQLGEDGEIYVALRPVVEALGLDWSGQLQRVKYHHQRWWLVVLHLEGATSLLSNRTTFLVWLPICTFNAIFL